MFRKSRLYFYVLALFICANPLLADEFDEAPSGTSVCRRVAQGLQGTLSQRAMRRAAKIIVNAVPGARYVAGAMMFYAQPSKNFMRGSGTIARIGGEFVREAVLRVPGGTSVVDAAAYLKPAHCATLTEGLLGAVTGRASKIRVRNGIVPFVGDSISATVSFIPFVGPYVAKTGRVLGKMIDPEARSLSEGLASINWTQKFVDYHPFYCGAISEEDVLSFGT